MSSSWRGSAASGGSSPRYSTVQYSAVQYSTVQYSTVQYSTVQCNATHHEALPGLAAGAGGRDGRHPGGVIGGDQTIYETTGLIRLHPKTGCVL